MTEKTSYLIRVDVDSNLSSKDVRLSNGDWVLSEGLEGSTNIPSYLFGESGYPWQGSQWYTQQNASATFTFYGSAVSAFGTSRIYNIPSVGVVGPEWACYVDGVQIEDFRSQLSPKISKGMDVYTPGANHAKLCGTQDLDDGIHTLTVNVTTQPDKFFPNKAPGNQDIHVPGDFWLDYFHYRPLLSGQQSLPVTAIIQPDSPTVTITGRWDNQKYPDGTRKVTNETGTTMSVDFSGTRVTFYGTQHHCQPRDVGNITYSIDDHPTTIINTSPPPCIPRFVPGGHSDASNQIIIQSPTVDPGRHHFTIRFDSGQGEYPLMIDYLVVDDYVHPTDAIKKSVPTNNRISVGVIIAVAAPLALIALITINFAVYRRRRYLQNKATQVDHGEILPFSNIRDDSTSGQHSQRSLLNIPSLATALGIIPPEVSNRPHTQAPSAFYPNEKALRPPPSSNDDPTQSHTPLTIHVNSGSTNVISEPPSRHPPHESDGIASEAVFTIASHPPPAVPTVETTTPLNTLHGLRDVQVVDVPPAYSVA